VPTSALCATPAIESFCWRLVHQIGEGGFALISGEPGTGKSAVLRILADRIGALRDARVGILSRPQASVADFYRELGDLFGVTLTASNRWGGAKALRQKWQAHTEASLQRPVLLMKRRP
jgi:dephospho-CoA kinase